MRKSELHSIRCRGRFEEVSPPEKVIKVTESPNYIHRIPAMREHMPARGGNIARFRRYNPLIV
ncbi:hypothetical protein UFOVP97_46 [uncultured Caudovirales phage]|uniref:Uncharacterized protein n=1 Tax=uncultured Caudovirales phage TaxID=2100421 RepID=A0A6J5KYY0_9CAUD|nr:hypothetical protein UFOVP97_46 [uncultured Caudovirales phage]CAB4134034.1 hypothetical protein UFOVP268_8 [uncultured Caudovirales phage]